MQSYKHKHAFIVTQNPMESTSGDFWQMIMESDCRVIVMLCSLQEDGQVCIAYATTYVNHNIIYNNECFSYKLIIYNYIGGVLSVLA